MPAFTIYSCSTLVAMAGSLLVWLRLFRRDRQMLPVFFGALFGAVVGAKIVYILAEGWLAWGTPDVWANLLVGKTLLGALLGGYLGVEIGKWLAGYRQPTGDTFAVMVPAGIALGRVGCLLQGCCLGKECPATWWTLTDAHGIPRWPAVPVEIAFNLLALATILLLRRRKLFPGQLFHLYLIAYGLFRFLHEPLRNTPSLWSGLTGYQIAALLVALTGVIGFYLRQKSLPPTQLEPAHQAPANQLLGGRRFL